MFSGVVLVFVVLLVVLRVSGGLDGSCVEQSVGEVDEKRQPTGPGDDEDDDASESELTPCLLPRWSSWARLKLALSSGRRQGGVPPSERAAEGTATHTAA
ncbi:hypothetical protein EYF80_050180 [Liparis tanakae]|uniref:Secreted protein n=1 Tax=Liparis tanakae TaxID=230148 RepID=A0A4Z2FER5_9TELE|nr:hypothetical protein EYF80_050180 [Liparis tanakae]